jgi:hypothetical protein
MDFKIFRISELNLNSVPLIDGHQRLKLFFKPSLFISTLLTDTKLNLSDCEDTFLDNQNRALCITFPPLGKKYRYVFAVFISYKLFKNNLTLDRFSFDSKIDKIIDNFILENADLKKILENEYFRLEKQLNKYEMLEDRVINEFSIRIAYFVDSFVQASFLKYSKSNF